MEQRRNSNKDARSQSIVSLESICVSLEKMWQRKPLVLGPTPRSTSRKALNEYIHRHQKGPIGKHCWLPELNWGHLAIRVGNACIAESTEPYRYVERPSEGWRMLL